MLPCSSIQRLERVAGTLSSSSSSNQQQQQSSGSTNQLQNASTFVWTSLKDQDQLNVITLCDTTLWETSTEFLSKKSQNPISESLALAMSRATQLLVGLRQLGDEEVHRRAEEAANKARKKFSNNTNSNFVIETKFEPFVVRCNKICACLCQLVANRRFRSVILRAVDRDVSTASVITDMFLAVSELLFGNNNNNSNKKVNLKILSQLHRLLFSMILFLSAVKEKNSNNVATLGLMFHRSAMIGPHVENNFKNSQQQQQQQKDNKNNNNKKEVKQVHLQTPKTSVIETILDLPYNSGQELLAALLKPILDTHGARAAVYYNFNVAALTKNKVNQAEFTSFMNLIEGTHTKFFPPQKQLEFLASVYLAFTSCENADEYFQEKKKALIRSELKAAFSNNNRSSTGLSSLLLGANNNNSKRESSVASNTTTTTMNSNSLLAGNSSTSAISSANIRVSLMGHVLVRMTKILLLSYDFSSSSTTTTNDNQAAAASKLFENLTQQDKINITKSWWISVQQLFEGLHRSRALVASDDLRYNNGFGFDSVFRLVKLLLLDTLDVIISSKSSSNTSTATSGKSSLLLSSASAMTALFSSSTATILNNNNEDTLLVCKDVAVISQLESTLKSIAPSFLLLLSSSSTSSSEGTATVLSSICKCLTCIGRLAPTHLMRFLPTVIRSLTKVQSNNSTNSNNHDQILEFLCFSIDHLGKLNQASSFLKSLLKEVLSLKMTTSKNLLLFDILQHSSVYNAVRKAASESLDAETILSVSTEIAEAAIEHGISTPVVVLPAKKSVIKKKNKNDSSSSDDDTNDNLPQQEETEDSADDEKKNCFVLFKIARAIVDGIAANPVSGLTVTEQLVAADATMSFAISAAIKEALEQQQEEDENEEDSEQSSSGKTTKKNDLAGLFDALEFVTSCRKKLFTVLQNAGVPSIDQLLVSLNKTTWQFPTQIPLLLGAEGVSPSMKQLVKILKKMSTTSSGSDEHFVICKYFAPLAASQLRLAAMVSQLVGEDSDPSATTDDDDAAAVGESSVFDIVSDAGAQSLAKTVSKQLTKFCYHFLEDNNSSSTSSSSALAEILTSQFNIEQQDLLLLRQLDGEGSEALITYLLSAVGGKTEKLFTSFAASGSSIVDGTKDIWKQERGVPAVANTGTTTQQQNTANNKSSSSKKQNNTNNKNKNKNDEDAAAAAAADVSKTSSSNPLVENSDSFVSAIFDLFKNYSSSNGDDGSSSSSDDDDDDEVKNNNNNKEQSTVFKAIREIIWKLTSKSQNTKSQQIRQNLIASLNSVKNDASSSSASAATCYLKTLQVLIDTSKKIGTPSMNEKELSSLFELWGNIINHTNDSDSNRELFFEKLLPSLTRLSTTKMGFIVGKAIEYGVNAKSSSSSPSQQISVISSILRSVMANGVTANNLIESNGILRSLHKLIESTNLSLFTSTQSQNSSSSFTLLVNDTLWLCKLSLQCFVAHQQQHHNNPASNAMITLLNNFQQQLLAFIVFLDRCLILGSKTQSRLIIRRVCEALAYLYGDIYEGNSSSSTSTSENSSTNNNNNNNQHYHLAVSVSAKRKQIQQALQLHASKFALDIISVVSAPWMFSITSCAETLLRLSAVSLSEEAISAGGDGTLGANRSLILKWLCLDGEASTTLHETAITLLAAAANNNGGGEAAERMGGKNNNNKISIRRTGGASVSSNTDANDFIFVALTNWPEAQLRLKSLHMEASERV